MFFVLLLFCLFVGIRGTIYGTICGRGNENAQFIAHAGLDISASHFLISGSA